MRLQELIDTRQAIQIKYHLVPEADDNEGFDTIRKKVDAEIARANARGQMDAPVTVYEHAVTASAQGMAAVNQQIDTWYDSEHALIALMTDEAEKQKALNDLNTKYNADRKAATLEYAELLKGFITPVWEQEDIQQAGTDIDALTEKLTLLSASSETDKPKLLEEINQMVSGMDEGSLVEYLGLLTQVQSLLDSGMTEDEVSALFPEMDFTKQLEQVATIQAFLKDRKTLIPGLTSIFSEAIPEEMITLTTDLDMTGAQARWAEFAANPGAITTEAIISSVTIDAKATVPQPVVDALVQSYKEIEGGASKVQLAPSDVVAQVSSYMESNGCSIAGLSPDQITAIVNAYSEATECDKSALMQAFTVQIAAYDDTNAVKPKLSLRVSITGYDLAAYNEFVTNHPVEVEGRVRLGEVYDNPADVLRDPNASFYENGQQIPVEAVPAEKLTADTLFVYEADGTMHVLITPVVEGTEESLTKAEDLLHSTEHQGSIGAKWFGDDTLTDVKRLNEYLTKIKGEMNSFLNIGGWMNDWDRKAASDTMSNYLDVTEIGNIQAYVSEAIAALNSGQTLSEDTMTNLQSILELVNLMDSIGIGENVIAGIGEGMTDAGLETDAESVATNLETALNTALDIHSPSVRMHPVGENVAAGIGEGAAEYSFDSYANTVADNAENALMMAFSATVFKPIGINAMNGLANGIRAGQSGVVSAMRSAANAAVTAAKKALDIHSPSRVFRDEVGRMAMKGFGEGISQESNAQAKTILNAARYLTNAAKEGTIAPTMHTNHRTVNNSSSVNLSGNSFYIRDEQDIYALATEIATLTKRQQRGKGLRMA